MRQLSPTSLVVRENWNIPSDFIRGLWLTFPGTDIAAVQTATFDKAGAVITLTTALSGPVIDGMPFEVRFADEAPIVACRILTSTPARQPLPPLALRLATTRGTNALLTRSGDAPVFFVTRGFGDVLEIGTQQRPDLFALDIEKPHPLYERVVEVSERLSADGDVLYPLDENALWQEATRLVQNGRRTAAVALLHSDQNPAHEKRVAEILSAAGFTHVSLSSGLSPFIKIQPRAETAVVNAYLSPVVTRYLEGVRAALTEETTLHVMTSAGGLVGADNFRPKDSLLSGPAGGIVGAARAGAQAGFSKLITFDMGGTSTDVARIDGGFDYVWEHRVGDAHLVAPALAIETVAAGGGTICDAGRFGVHVGPASAGAVPGPACYGAAGPLTLTDVNLLLGRIVPERFEIPLYFPKAEEAVEALVNQLLSFGTTLDRDALLDGFLDIANERMADAIRRVSVRQGYDPQDYALLAFGGAGGQHACGVAERLGMQTVVVPPDASLLSAWGIGQASIERFAERQVLRTLDDMTDAEVTSLFEGVTQEAFRFIAQDITEDAPRSVKRRLVNLRLAGQETTHAIEYDFALPLRDAFLHRFEQIFGYPPPPDRKIEIESVRVIVGTPSSSYDASTALTQASRAAPTWIHARFDKRWGKVPAYERGELALDQAIVGPALILERHSVTVVGSGWTCQALGSGALVLRRGVHSKPDAPHGVVLSAPDAVTAELYAGRFAAVAEEMGEQLRQNSISTNVKERLDFSCALLDAGGELVATAAHIPVHLGALGLCVRRLQENIAMGPGDVIVTNHPGFGGSHLPDITVVTPVHDSEEQLLGYVASRAHHAEIGGKRPGSMPPDATSLVEEGVVLPPMSLVRAGTSQVEEVCRKFAEGPYPSRAVADNRADLEAALAAGRRGAAMLKQMAAEEGAATVRYHMNALKAQVEARMRAALARLPDGDRSATEALDDGSLIAVRVRIEGDRAEIDFAGTGATHKGNLNAPPAVATSVVLYVLRLLIGEALPLNEGLLRPVSLRLPEGTLVNPWFDLEDSARCPAVVGGNTEVSQRIVDTLLKALGMAACSQGTMNNVLWGNERFGYYETVCGGAGASVNAPGASMVHTHMTNTRITDAEILERRYPVRVERFARRSGSGGAGLHPGGDGVVREVTFLEPMRLSVLTQHRRQGPYGMEGGAAGEPGRQRLLRADGSVTELGATDGAEVQAGDRLILETPGGGGWGVAESAPPPVTD